MIILNSGLAVKTARPRLSSLFIGNRSPSLGSVYDSTNGTSINLCRRSIRILKCSYVPTSVLGNEMRRNSASNCKTVYNIIIHNIHKVCWTFHFQFWVHLLCSWSPIWPSLDVCFVCQLLGDDVILSPHRWWRSHRSLKQLTGTKTTCCTMSLQFTYKNHREKQGVPNRSAVAGTRTTRWTSEEK